MTHPDRADEAKGEDIARPEATAVVRAVSIEFRGALPHPQLLKQYDEVVPGAAERIVGLAERQVHHRQSMEGRSQTFTFSLALITVLGGIVLIALGRAAQGLVPLVAAVAGLGGLFVYREVRSHRDPGKGLDRH
jgi:uncharacterized membrane protein